MVPVLLHSGIHPRVAAATSAYNYFFIGLTNVVKLIFDGFITKLEIAWFFGLAVFEINNNSSYLERYVAISLSN